MAEQEARDGGVIESVQLCAEYRSVCEASEIADDRAKELRKRKKELSLKLATAFLSEGRQNTKMDGRTFALTRNVRCNKVGGFSMTEACEALTNAGLEDFVSPSYSASSLTAYVREALQAADPGTEAQDVLPSELRSMFKTMEEFTVVMTGR